MKYIILFPNFSQQAPKCIVVLVPNRVTARLYVDVTEYVRMDLKFKLFVSSTVSYTHLEGQLLVDSTEWPAAHLICCHCIEVSSYLVSMHCHCKILWFMYLYTSVV